VSKHWLESSNIDTLWQSACATRWGSKEVPHIAKRQAISLFPRLRMSAAALGRLSVKELRLIISQMGLDSSACVEKGEMRALVTGGMPRELMGVFRWSYEHDSKWKVKRQKRKSNLCQSERACACVRVCVCVCVCVCV
jgi:hypothetical protein